LRDVNAPGVEVSMPHPRTAKSNVLFVTIATVAFMISGLVMASPNPSAQEGNFVSLPQEGHVIPAPRGQGHPIRLEVLSSVPDKVNLDPYLRRVYVSIQRNLLARLPESALNGEKGVVVVRVHIEKDGSLPEGAVRIVTSCGNEDMDAAAKSAIRTAAPFGRFPEAYVSSNLDLLFTFGFAPQAPAQKPKVVPVGTAANHIRQT
jgi:TonB family protein